MAWWDNALFDNRPPLTLQAIKVRAGFEGTQGTYDIPTGYFFMQDYNADSVNAKVNVSAVDSWGKYGDSPSGTLAVGTYDISRTIEHMADMAGIPKEKQYIDAVRKSYTNAPVMNNKNPWDNGGGFGDIYNTQVPYLYTVHPQIKNFTQTTSGSYFAFDYNQQFAVNDVSGTNMPLISIALLTITNNRFESLGLHQSPFSLNDDERYQSSQYSKIALQTVDSNNLIVHRIIKKGFNNGGTVNIIESAAYKTNPMVLSHYIGSTTFPITLTEWSYGWFWDDNQGTGFFTHNDQGTAQMYRVNLSQGTKKLSEGNAYTITGTDTLGTQTVDCMFMMPHPIHMYNGTANWYYCAYGRLGTFAQTHMFRYKGTGTIHDYVDIGTIGNQWMLGTQIIPDGQVNSGTYYGMGTILYSGGWVVQQGVYENLGHRLTASRHPAIMWYNSNEIFHTGHWGFNFQHRTISNVGSLYINGIHFPAGTNYQLSSDNTLFHLNTFRRWDERFDATYDIYGMQIALDGTMGGKTFKELCEKLSIPANHYCWFDGNGNFFFRRRDAVQGQISIGDNIDRGWTDYLIENHITASASKDINKVKNWIIVSGAVAAGTNQADVDNSMTIYGTRKIEYSNPYIYTSADCGTLALQLSDYLSTPRYEIQAEIPFNPAIELVDHVKFVDGVNKISVDNASIKKVTHNFDKFTTTIWAEEIPAQKTQIIL